MHSQLAELSLLQSITTSSDELLHVPGQEPISWADLIVLSAKVAHVLSWTESKVKRATVASGGSTIADAFGAAFPLPLGRVDATSPDDAVQIPNQSASPAEVKVRHHSMSLSHSVSAVTSSYLQESWQGASGIYSF